MWLLIDEPYSSGCPQIEEYYGQHKLDPVGSFKDEDTKFGGVLVCFCQLDLNLDMALKRKF